jgi:4-diphosphocytidyl-2-C-methyl-D-erythritol kinase
MRVDARAKLNLSLRVLAREASGYHQIETLFCALELADTIELELAGDDITLDVQSPGNAVPIDLGPPDHNLAVRAARAYAEWAPDTRGVRIRLTKRIPHGAGLGGGSADAAAVLSALNALHDGRLSLDEQLELGANLGSDVPFFLSGAACAFAWGRGHRVMPVAPLPQRHVLLAMPSDRVPTADAYAALSHHRGHTWSAPPAIVPAHFTTWADVARNAHNDFEDVVFMRLPRQRTLRDALERAGAAPARLTGTGSAVFGVFEREEELLRAQQLVTAQFPDIACMLTRTALTGGVQFPGVDSNHH